MGRSVMFWVPENPEDPSDKGNWHLADIPYSSMIASSRELLLNALKVSTDNPNFEFGDVWDNGDDTDFSNNGMYGTNTSGTIVEQEILVSTWKDALGEELDALVEELDALGEELDADLSKYKLMVAIGREC